MIFLDVFAKHRAILKIIERPNSNSDLVTGKYRVNNNTGGIEKETWIGKQVTGSCRFRVLWSGDRLCQPTYRLAGDTWEAQWAGQDGIT